MDPLESLNDKSVIILIRELGSQHRTTTNPNCPKCGHPASEHKGSAGVYFGYRSCTHSDIEVDERDGWLRERIKECSCDLTPSEIQRNLGRKQ